MFFRVLVYSGRACIPSDNFSATADSLWVTDAAVPNADRRLRPTCKRWYRLARNWVENSLESGAQGKDPAAEFLRQTTAGAVVNDADHSPAASEFIH